MPMRAAITATLSLFSLTAFAATSAATAQEAAPAAARLSAGTAVYDSEGQLIGKIEAEAGPNVVIGLEGGSITIPVASFGQSPKGPVLSVTRAELIAARDQAAAEQAKALEAALQPGVDVRGANGAVILGKVKMLAADDVVVATPSRDVKLPRTAFFLSPAGPAMNLTPDQFAAAMNEMDAAAAKREAAVAAALEPGAEVRSIKGRAVLGTVRSVHGDVVVVATSSGEVSVKRASFLVSPEGLAVAYTPEQFAKAVGGATASSER